VFLQPILVVELLAAVWTFHPSGFVVDLTHVETYSVLVLEALVTLRTLRVLTPDLMHFADMLLQPLHVLAD
jgi:hypothetical protein